MTRPERRSARTALLAAAGAVAGLVLLAFVLVGVDSITGSDGSTTTHVPTPDAQPSTSGDEASPQSPTASPFVPSTTAATRAADDDPTEPLPPLLDTDDPDLYAAAVAEALFGMDYTSHTPGDYKAFFDAALWDEIVDEDRMRILATISRRIPTADMWEQMRSVEQTSEFEVELVWEPRTGQDHREAGTWPDGVMLRNVSGTQTETWRAPDEEIQTSTRQVAVTVGVACPPASSPCRLVSIQPTVES
ncbi:MAG: hypothetical protein ACOC9R_02725 [bacterium]